MRSNNFRNKSDTHIKRKDGKKSITFPDLSWSESETASEAFRDPSIK